MGIKRVPCYLEGFEEFGLIVGALLQQNDEINISYEFRNFIEKEIAKFCECHENTPREVEKYFNRFIRLNVFMISKIK